MKYVRRGDTIYVDKGLTDQRDLFDRLERELATAGHPNLSERGRNRFGLPKLTLRFMSRKQAKAAEKWIDKKFQV